MSDRVPPKFALWLLKQWGSPYHRESLAGDLIEQYQEGRSRAWCLAQVTAAALVAVAWIGFRISKQLTELHGLR